MSVPCSFHDELLIRAATKGAPRLSFAADGARVALEKRKPAPQARALPVKGRYGKRYDRQQGNRRPRPFVEGTVVIFEALQQIDDDHVPGVDLKRMAADEAQE